MRNNKKHQMSSGAPCEVFYSFIAPTAKAFAYNANDRMSKYPCLSSKEQHARGTVTPLMSETGQLRRFGDVRAISALPLIADVRCEDRQVRKVPGTDSLPRSSYHKQTCHLIRSRKVIIDRQRKRPAFAAALSRRHAASNSQA